MELTFNARGTVLNGKRINHNRGDRNQLALMIKARLGL